MSITENIYQSDHTQKPPVFDLIERNETQAVIGMLEADPTLINLKGWMDDTPLHISAFHNNFEIVKYLIEHDADVNARRADGGTALYWVNKGEIAEYLIKNGASLDHDSYYNPLNWAVRYERSDVMEVLIHHGMNINGNDKYPILEVRDIACLSIFFKYKADLNLHDDYGRNILHLIAWYDNAPLMDYALSIGIEWTRNKGGETPYHVAIKSKRLNVVSMLEDKYPSLTANIDREENILNREINDIQKFIFIHSTNSIVSIGRNAYLSLWQIKDNKVILKRSLQLNRSNIASIAYKEGELFFIIPNEKNGTLELRDINTLRLISIKALPISSPITAIAYARNLNFLLIAESWSPIYKVDLNFNIQASTEIDYGIFDFSFDKDSQLIGVDCYDQNEFTELYKFGNDASLNFVMDFFKESEAFSSSLYFNPFREQFAISYSKELLYYSYQDGTPKLLWKIDIPNSSKPYNNSYIDYVDQYTLIWGHKDTIRIVNCTSSKIIKSHRFINSAIRKIFFIKESQQILGSTNSGFLQLDLKENLIQGKKSWWKFW